MTQLEVVGPAAQVPVELLDEVRQWGMTLLRAYDLAQHLSFPCHRLAAGMQVPVALRLKRIRAEIPECVNRRLECARIDPASRGVHSCSTWTATRVGIANHIGLLVSGPANVACVGRIAIVVSHAVTLAGTNG